MVLLADIGNSTTTLALVEEGGAPSVRCTFSTDSHATGDQYALQLFSMLQFYHVDPHHVTGGVIASVVPPVTAALAAAVERLVGKPPLIVGAGVRTGLNIRAEMHAQLGADIVAYCVGAVAKYLSPVIVVDLSTAITFSVLRGSTYEGCVIAPGVRVGLEALSRHAAELPHISLSEPSALLGRNTVDAMRSGALYGNASLVDGMIARLEEATEPAATVVATGSCADDILPYCRRTILRDPDLLLEGLYLIYQKNSDPRKRGRAEI